MIGNIMIGQYFPGQSVLHKLDPRTKIMGILIFFGVLLTIDNVPSYGMVIIFTLTVAGLSQISGKILLMGLKPLWWIILLTMSIHFFSTPGHLIGQWGPFELTIEGIRQGIFMTLRIVLLIFVFSLLTLTTSPISLTDGIERLLSPLRTVGVPAHELAMMMTIALRFIPTIIQETEKIIKAQTGRGADFTSGSIIKRATNTIPILVPLLINAFRRADELAMAMESRCYKGGQGRTRMWEMKMGAADMVALIVTSSLVVGAVILRSI